MKSSHSVKFNRRKLRLFHFTYHRNDGSSRCGDIAFQKFDYLQKPDNLSSRRQKRTVFEQDIYEKQILHSRDWDYYLGILLRFSAKISSHKRRKTHKLLART